jgi:pimeloyl-ACP methyl ester carboxylesterase
MPTFEGSDAAILYEQVGHGPDVVWVSGGGNVGRDWHLFQIPYFERFYRNTTFDNRGIGRTTSATEMPWGIDAFARDTAELIEAACDPPVTLIGISFGSAIVQQVAIDFPHLVRAAIVMGTGAWSTGWAWDYQQAEIDFRKAGGELTGLMGACHYASMLYPARVLGDRELWPKLRDILVAWMGSGENESSLIPQWEASLLFDQREQLPTCDVPFDVVAFTEDVQAPPQDGEELADLLPNAEYHLLDEMGHGSWFGHAHDRLNPFLKELVDRRLP